MAMVALITNDLLNYEYYLRQPWLILLLAFQIWMLVDAVKRQEWLWAVLIFIFFVSGGGAIFSFSLPLAK